MTRLTASWLTDPAAEAVCGALAAEGFRSLFVGGCVRNTLLGEPVTDIDIATDARPADTIRLTETAGLRAVPTGVAHGTVTVISGGQAFEVTTFRRDVETDGRRAVVAFSDRVEEDAARRDFTMNALYATMDGTLIDPEGGLSDLQARRLRFIGDPARRIAEDYLRILRFFRFYAWYADPAQGPDAEGLAACAGGLDGLAHVSAERIGQEMRKLLSALDPAPAVAAMAQTGALAHVLPGAVGQPLPALVHLEAEANAKPDPFRRLAAMGGADPATRLRLSRVEARHLQELRADLASGQSVAELAWRHGAARALDVALLRAALGAGSLPADLDARIAQGVAAEFPVKAVDLMPVLHGPALGAQMKALEAAWIASDFTLGHRELLQIVNGSGDNTPADRE
ncbi:MAG: CCA tRNA nucleotidyltransferase [Pseudomonadota bacterium]